MMDLALENATDEFTQTGEISTQPNVTEYLETQIAEELWKYCSIILIVVGTVGNVLAICILLRRNMRSSTTMFYLTAMAIADLFVLYTGLLRQWVKYVYNIDVRVVSTASCRAHLFLVYCSLDVAVWTIVIVTVDRAIFVCSPFRAKTICTLRNARVVMMMLVIFICFVNIHFLWMIEFIESPDGTQVCDVSPTASPQEVWFSKTFHPWLDFCMYSFIPFFVMMVCNILIIRQMALSRRRLAAHFKREEARIAAGQIPTITKTRKISRKIRRSQCSSVTVTLLTVNIVFLLTTSPVVIFLLGHDKWFAAGDEHDRAVLNLTWAIVNILLYLNNAVHFFLYCLTGPKFRREILSMFQRKNRIDTVVDQSTTLELYNTNYGRREQM